MQSTDTTSDAHAQRILKPTQQRRSLAEEIVWYEAEVANKAATPAGRALLLAAAGPWIDLRRHARKVAARKKSKALSGREMAGLDALRAAFLAAGELAVPAPDKSPTSATTAPDSHVQPAPTPSTGVSWMEVEMRRREAEAKAKEGVS